MDSASSQMLQLAACAPPVFAFATLVRTRGLTQYENCPGVDDILLRSRFIARRDIRGNRLAGTDGLPAAKRTSSFGVAGFQRTLRPPDQDRYIYGPGKGALTLLEPVWENC